MSEDVPKPQSTRRTDFLPEAYAHYLERADRTLLDKAKQMLRDDFVKQPLLTIYFSGEPWRQPLIDELQKAGYFRIPTLWNDRAWASYWPLDLPACFEIMPSAFAELRDA